MQLITNQLRQGGHPYWYFPFRLPWLWQLWQQYQLWWLAVTQVAVADCDTWHYNSSDGCGNNNRYYDCDVSYTVTPVTVVMTVTLFIHVNPRCNASNSCDCSDVCDASFSLKCDALFLKRKHLWTFFLTKTFLGFDSEPIFFQRSSIQNFALSKTWWRQNHSSNLFHQCWSSTRSDRAALVFLTFEMNAVKLKAD